MDARLPEAFPFPVLIGDIGGTNARFALIEDAHARMVRFPTSQTADFETIDDAIETVLRSAPRPRTAMLALAGPITGERVQLTNSPWVVEPKRTIARFSLSEMILLNDFEAQSLSLPGLGHDDVEILGNGRPSDEGTRIVVGPGTGLGAGALLHVGGIWVPVPGEGGHVDLGPVTDLDMAIWPHLERAHGRISAEALLSGQGLVRLYRALTAADGAAAPLKTPADISAAGLSGADPYAAETLTLFSTYLGRFAGDLAMVFIAHGGVYLGGGIATRIAATLRAGAFRAAFTAKAPHEALMESMATMIITRNDAALAGIGDFARAPRRFGVELGGRRWQG